MQKISPTVSNLYCPKCKTIEPEYNTGMWLCDCKRNIKIDEEAIRRIEGESTKIKRCVRVDANNVDSVSSTELLCKS